MPSTHDHAPPSPSASEGSSSGSSAPPSTPPLSTSLPMSTFMNLTSDDTINGVPSLAGAKRTAKNTRRVNTAERRATHNAVERARRETLNGRFLDLAGLLPNLNTIRRPSKSAIVNSSIAHLNASRRHRLLAAQQLHMLKEETDALRHELNQWRARNAVHPVPEPIRGDAFSIVLSGELEIDQADMLDGSEEGEEDDGNYGPASAGPYSAGPEPLPEEYEMHRRHHAEMLARARAEAEAQHHAGYPPEASSPHSYYAPTIVDPALAAYEDPAAGYYEQSVPYIEEQHWAAAAAYEKQRRMSVSGPYARPVW